MRNGYYISPRGLCRITFFHEGPAVFFYDSGKVERFKKDSEVNNKYREITLKEATEYRIVEDRDFLYNQASGHPFVQAFRKEPDLPLMTVYAEEYFRLNINQETHCHGFSVRHVWENLYAKDEIRIGYEIQLDGETEDNGEYENKRITSEVSVPNSLLEAFTEAGYKAFIKNEIQKHRKKIKDHIAEKKKAFADSIRGFA